MANTKIVLNRQSDLILNNAQIIAPVGIVVSDISGLVSSFASVDGQISTEASLRAADVSSLSTDLSNEISDRIDAVSAESSDRVAGDLSLETDLSIEASIRIVGETSLQNNISAEASLRLAADDAEESRATAAEGSLENLISDEELRATTAETSLGARIDYIVSNTDQAALDSLTEIVGAFQSADGNLNNAITSLATAATTSLSAEASLRVAADSSLASDLSSEIVARASALSAEISSRISGDNSISLDLSSEIAARQSAITSESLRAASVEQALSNDLGNLSLYVDSTVDTAISTLTSDLGDEASIRLAADNSLDVKTSDAMSVEVAARIAGDESLASDLSDLSSYVDSTVNTAISTLTSDLDVETSRAIAAEASLDAKTSDAIASEVESRIAADNSLSARIDFVVSNTDQSALDSLTEIVAAFQSADGDINNAITNLATAATTSLSAEASRAMDAEASLASDLSDLSSYVDSTVNTAISTLTSDLDDEASIRLAADESLASDLSDLSSYVDTTVNTAITTLTSDLDVETSRAVSAEQSIVDMLGSDLGSDISVEVSSRIAGDSYLQSEIDALALADGDTLDINYVDNTIRLKEVVAAPDSGVRFFEGDIKVGAQPDSLPTYDDSSLITRGILNNRITSEVNTLNSSLSDETNRAMQAESSLDESIGVERGRIDAILAAADANVDTFREVVDLINSVDTENDQAFASYVLSNNAALSAETSERLRLTNLLGDDLLNEAIIREDADAYLQHEIDVLPMTDGRTIEIDYNENTIRLKEFINTTDSGIRVFEGDVKAAAQPDTLPTFGDLSYVTKAYVDDKVTDDITAAIIAEEDARTSADVALHEVIDAEISALAASFQNGLSSDISAEVSSRVLGDAILQSEIDALALTDGDTLDINYADNTVRLKEVVAAPDSGVRFFEGDIKVGAQPDSLPTYDDSSLITRGILNSRITSEVNTLNSSLSDETNRAMEAEASLDSSIGVERGRIDAILAAADANVDTFREVVDLINSVDTENDQAFASYVLSNNAALSVEVSERLRLTNLLGDDLLNEAIVREDADAYIQHEIDSLPMTDGATIEVNYNNNTIRLKEFINTTDSGMRIFEGDVKAAAQPDTLSTFGDLSYVTKSYVDNKVGNDLTAAIDAEESERIAADAALQEMINTEASLRIEADASLATALSTEVSYLLDNTDFGSMDSFVEVSNELSIEMSSEIARAESAEASLAYDIQAIYAKHVSVNESADGTIATFSLSVPVRPGSELIYVNGLLQDYEDYTANVDSNNQVVSVTLSLAPDNGSKVRAYGVYGYPNHDWTVSNNNAPQAPPLFGND